MKKLFVITMISIFILVATSFSMFAAEVGSLTPPIASGKTNKIAYIYWGKSEMYPVISMVGSDTKLDIYEYDKDWVLVLYEKFIKVENKGQAQAFYGYLKRSDITCDPALVNDVSVKADTGLGKRKGNEPNKTVAGSSRDTSEATDTTEAKSTSPSQATTKPSDTKSETSVEQLEEYDWIIRTPGLCKKTIKFDVADFVCSFEIMAEKFGGVAASSDPLFNNGLHNPYAAMGFFSMEAPTESIVENIGMSGLWSGSDGINMFGQAPGTKIYMDTKSDDFSLINFTINFNMNSSFGVSITTNDSNNIKVKAPTITAKSSVPFKIQLKKLGKGYVFVLLNMKPGGGNLEFPAVLEKAMSDPDKYKKEAKAADERRKAAEELRKQKLDKLKKGNGIKDSSGKDTDLAPLVPPEDDLAPLVPKEDDLASLVPVEGDEANSFPSQKP